MHYFVGRSWLQRMQRTLSLGANQRNGSERRLTFVSGVWPCTAQYSSGEGQKRLLRVIAESQSDWASDSRLRWRAKTSELGEYDGRWHIFGTEGCDIESWR